MKHALKIIVLLLSISLLFTGCAKGNDIADENNDTPAAELPLDDDKDSEDDLVFQQSGNESGGSGSSGTDAGNSTGQNGNTGSNQGSGSGTGSGSGNTQTPPETTPPAPPSFSSSNVMTSVVAEVSTFMTRVNGIAEGLGYVEISLSTSYTEEKIITELVDMFRLEANTYGNTVFDLAYHGIVGSNHVFRLYRA